jgi:hypothetical protein
VDCPAHAEFLNITQYYLTGEPVVHMNAICVFEQDQAIPVRRHYESLKGSLLQHLYECLLGVLMVIGFFTQHRRLRRHSLAIAGLPSRRY